MKKRSLALFVALGIAWGTPAAAQTFDITARVTADNAYAFGWGDVNSISPNNYWPQASTGALAVNNMSAGDIYNCVASPTPFVPSSGAELYPNLHPTITDYIYIVGFSDLSVQQGTIGDFRDNISGQILGSGNPNWQVYATGINTAGNQAPTLTQINAQIALANNNQGPAATSSVGWVGLNAVAGRVGRLVTTAQGSSLPAMPACIGPSARWMWYQDDLDPSGTAFNAFTSQPQAPGRSREFLIFRLPVKAFVSGYDIQTTKSACPLSPGVTAYGLTVTNLGQAINGPAQIEVLEFVPPGLTVAAAVTPPWQCTPTNTVGPDVITCKYDLPAGSTIAQGAALPPIMISATGEAKCPNCMRAKLYIRGREGDLHLASEMNSTNNISCK